MKYKCRNPFTSTDGKDYKYGVIIDSDEYNSLYHYERRNFVLYTEEESPKSNDTSISETPLWSSFFTSSDDSPSIDISSNDTSSNDFGGGGAGGDW